MDFVSIMFILTELFLVIEFLQTRYIAKNPEEFQDNNFVIGPHPTLTQTNIYFLICMFAAALFWVFGLSVMLILFSVLEFVLVLRNMRAGVGLG